MSRVSDRMSSPGWVTVLRSAGAQDTYLRTYRGALDAARVVQFLLHGQAVPALGVPRAAAGRDLPDRAGQPADGRGSARRPRRCGCSGRARSELEFLRPDELLDDLPAQLTGLQETIRDVGEAVSLQYFHAAPWVAWTARR